MDKTKGKRIISGFENVSAAGRRAVQLGQWATVGRCASELLRLD